MTKNIISILLALCILLSVTACSGNGAETPSSSLPTSSDSGSSEDTSSDESSKTPSGGNNYIGSGDFAGTKNPVTSSEESSYVDTTTDVVVWDHPEVFSIIFPVGDNAVKDSALAVQRYFSKNYNVNLPVKSDTAAESPYEILVGKTNRKESNKNIAFNKYNVSVKDKKLIFDGGHKAMLDLAIQLFAEKKPKNNPDAKLSGTVSDFKAKMLDGYEYVWGDEFRTKELDFTRWCLSAKMGGTDKIKVVSTRETIDMKNDNLVLTALKSANKARTEYLVPTSVVTQWNMMYTYGYCEIRAKVPNATGVWPSFWTQSNTGVGKRSCFDYFVEVDIFEVFGDPSGKFIPNLHKWYNKNVYNYGKIHNQYDSAGEPIMHTTTGAHGASYPISNSGSTYHTFGYEWTPTEMSMYVDGKKYKTYNITVCYDKSGEMKGFHDPQFLIFNNHVFAKDASYKPNLIENNEKALPSSYCIDYFRLYQKPGVGKIWTDYNVKYTYSERD